MFSNGNGIVLDQGLFCFALKPKDSELSFFCGVLRHLSPSFPYLVTATCCSSADFLIPREMATR